MLIRNVWHNGAKKFLFLRHKKFCPPPRNLWIGATVHLTKVTFLQAFSDPSINKILLIVIVSDQKWAANLYPFLHLSFGTLSLSVFVPQIHYRLSKVYSRPFYVKRLFRQTSACTMSPRFSTCTLAMDFFHAISSCVFHIASFLQNIWIPLRECLDVFI